MIVSNINVTLEFEFDLFLSVQISFNLYLTPMHHNKAIHTDKTSAALQFYR